MRFLVFYWYNPSFNSSVEFCFFSLLTIKKGDSFHFYGICIQCVSQHVPQKHKRKLYIWIYQNRRMLCVEGISEDQFLIPLLWAETPPTRLHWVKAPVQCGFQRFEAPQLLRAAFQCLITLMKNNFFPMPDLNQAPSTWKPLPLILWLHVFIKSLSSDLLEAPSNTGRLL